MPLLHLILVAVIQGLTEFLPVSSSGHLVLLPTLTGLPDQGQAIDVAVHVGTLCAVIFYFRAETRLFLSGIPRLMTGKADTPGARLALLLLVASVPVAALGLLLKITGLDEFLRSAAVIGWAMLLFGILLYWADRTGPEERVGRDFSVRDAMILGLWQAMALIPGTSRSGIAITGARFLGYSRRDAARLAMLMSIPAIGASGLYLAGESAVNADMALLRDGAVAAAFAFVAALFALSLMMRLLRSVSFTPYVVYRVVVGGVLLVSAHA